MARTRDVPVDLTWTPKMPTGRIVVHAGRLVDGTQPTARTDVDIVIQGHRITAIEPHRADLHAQGTVVDATGRSVMPGLIEAHGHTHKEHGEAFGRIHLAYGITTVRSPGGHPVRGGRRARSDRLGTPRRPAPVSDRLSARRRASVLSDGDAGAQRGGRRHGSSSARGVSTTTCSRPTCGCPICCRSARSRARTRSASR